MNDIENPKVIVKMSTIIQTDPSIEIRKKAVYALGDRGPEATPDISSVNLARRCASPGRP
jgi:hypothetical protein